MSNVMMLKVNIQALNTHQACTPQQCMQPMERTDPAGPWSVPYANCVKMWKVREYVPTTSQHNEQYFCCRDK